MTEVAQAVMAVVHVQAPAQVDPHAIEAELVRAINTYRKRPMSAEFTLAPDHRVRSVVDGVGTGSSASCRSRPARRLPICNAGCRSARARPFDAASASRSRPRSKPK
jgi:hypothetical protein